METTTLDGFGGDVIVTEGMIDGRTGERIYGVFATKEDAASPDADNLSLGSVGHRVLTDEQKAMARRNTDALAGEA